MIVRRQDAQSVELQMGPLIDMVFLLLVFFMVTAKPVRQESDIGLSLPGTAPQDEPLEIPDEQRIAIAPDGQMLLNDLPVDGPGDRDLPGLVAILKRFRESADASRTRPIVTLAPDDEAQHQRIADALNACAKAGITGVTFEGASDDEPF